MWWQIQYNYFWWLVCWLNTTHLPKTVRNSCVELITCFHQFRAKVTVSYAGINPLQGFITSFNLICGKLS